MVVREQQMAASRASYLFDVCQGPGGAARANISHLMTVPSNVMTTGLCEWGKYILVLLGGLAAMPGLTWPEEQRYLQRDTTVTVGRRSVKPSDI